MIHACIENWRWSPTGSLGQYSRSTSMWAVWLRSTTQNRKVLVSVKGMAKRAIYRWGGETDGSARRREATFPWPAHGALPWVAVAVAGQDRWRRAMAHAWLGDSLCNLHAARTRRPVHSNLPFRALSGCRSISVCFL